MMTGNTAIHIASQLQSGAPRKAAFLVAVPSLATRSLVMRTRCCDRRCNSLVLRFSQPRHENKNRRAVTSLFEATSDSVSKVMKH